MLVTEGPRCGTHQIKCLAHQTPQVTVKVQALCLQPLRLELQLPEFQSQKALGLYNFFLLFLPLAILSSEKQREQKAKKKIILTRHIFDSRKSLSSRKPFSLLNSKIKSEAPEPQALAFFWMSHHSSTSTVTDLFVLGDMSSPLICLGRSLYLLRDHVCPSALTMLLLYLLLLFLYCPFVILPILAHHHNLLTTKIGNM